MNVFQFAETVEPDTWDDEKQKQDLEVCVTTAELALSLTSLACSDATQHSCTRELAQEIAGTIASS